MEDPRNDILSPTGPSSAGLGESSGDGVARAVAETIDTKPCPICGEPIKLGARKCTHCDSDLGWRKYLGFSNTTLAILTALVAVTGQVAPTVRSLWDVRDSRIHLTFIGTGSSRTIFEGHLMTGDVVLLAINDGSKAGGIVAGRLSILWTSDKREHVIYAALWPPGDEPEIVGPGTGIPARLFFDPMVETETGTEASDARTLIAPLEPGNPLTAPIERASCFVDITIANASGSTEEQHIPARCTALHPLIDDAVRSTFKSP